MDKREKLKELRKQHMRERAEVRDDEMYIRDGEDMRIERIRASMAGVLADPNLASEERKEKLAELKNSIEDILDARDEREHAFIEQELEHHRLEQELEQEIEAEERKDDPEPQDDSVSILVRARPFINAGAEQLRKNIEENRKELNEDEQFSTILINNSEREKMPGFITTRRKKREESQQTARIDTVLIKQREIGMMYRQRAEQQEQQLKKAEKGEHDFDGKN